jgi:hypothetical protein
LFDVMFRRDELHDEPAPGRRRGLHHRR